MTNQSARWPTPQAPGRRSENSYVEAMSNHGARFRGMPMIQVGGEDDLGPTEMDGLEGLMVCDICRVPLNRLTGGDIPENEIVWLHTRSWQHFDHDPVPRRKMENEDTIISVCDFCGSEEQMYWVFIGQRIRLGTGNTINDYGTSWSSCQTCAPMIEAGDLDALAAHAMRRSPSLKGRNRMEKLDAAEGWRTLWESFIPTIYERQYVGPAKPPAKLNPRLMPRLQQGLLRFWKNDILYKMVQDANRTKGLYLPGVHVGVEDQFMLAAPPNAGITPEHVENHAQHIRAGIMASDLYWVSSNFTRLAIMAGKDFNKVLISREELPSSFGFMVFEEPIGGVQRPGGLASIRAVTWTLVPRGVWINIYFQGEDGEPEVDVLDMRDKFGWLICPNLGVGLEFDQEIPLPEGVEVGYLLTIMSTWFLMTQPGVASQEAAPVDKKIARAYQREHNKKMPDVKLIELRRRPSRGGEPASHEGRKLTVRVYRRGHWKRQAYGPKRGMRKTIYVSAYIAGPEGAPLKENVPVVKVVR